MRSRAKAFAIGDAPGGPSGTTEDDGIGDELHRTMHPARQVQLDSSLRCTIMVVHSADSKFGLS